MLIEHQHPLNKNIVVSLLGAPNVGKSSLINYLLGYDLTAVTDRPQTTRNGLHCVLHVDRTEIVLVDTPGVHASNKELNKRMNSQAREWGVDHGVDLNLLLIDCSQDLDPQVDRFLHLFPTDLSRTWMVLTKYDLRKEALQKSGESGKVFMKDQMIERFKKRIPNLENIFIVSSKTGDNVHSLTGALCDAAVSAPHLYPGGEVSNKNERFFVSEYIREQAFQMLHEEVPYEIAVIIDEYKDFRENKEHASSPHAKKLKAYISATILVNRPSQRAIVVGKQGSNIKQIGTEARKKIEELLDGKVHLNLHVRVSPKWFKNNWVLEEIGLPRPNHTVRGWRKK